jgi:NADPH:quinone reductase-like Zn-dependent oxidoreductase
MRAGFGLLARPVFGFFGPRQPILGSELAGEIDGIGEGVTKFKIGDHVVAFPGIGMGCHAQYRTVPQDGRIVLKPAALSFAEAAAMPFGGTTALHFLRDLAGIRTGEKALIVGASGAVGSAAVQLAKYFGANVTGVCSTANLDLVRSIGADRVIDHTKEDFTGNGETYDIILDAVGRASFATCGRLLKENGRLLLVVASLPQVLASGSKAGNKKGPCRPRQGDCGAPAVSQTSRRDGTLQAGHRPTLPSRTDRRGTCACRDWAEEGQRHHHGQP